MNTERIEELLEELISKQDEIIDRLETVESKIEDKISDSNDQLAAIHEELNWWADSNVKCNTLEFNG